MKTSDDLPTSDKSVSTSPATGCGWHRLLWGASLLSMTCLLAMHVALAHSPDLARFVPDALIQSPPACSSHHTTPAITGKCSGGALPAFSGCRATGYVEPPLLTDSLYEDGSEVQPADAPADAAECVPQDETESDDRPTGLQA